MSEKTFSAEVRGFCSGGGGCPAERELNRSRAYGVRYLHAATARSHGHHNDAR